MNDLDRLLSEQDKIEERDFTTTVMARIPKKRRNRRVFILCLATLLGSLSCAMIMGSGDAWDSLLKLNYQSQPVLFISLVLSLLAFSGGLYSVASEELN